VVSSPNHGSGGLSPFLGEKFAQAARTFKGSDRPVAP